MSAPCSFYFRPFKGDLDRHPSQELKLFVITLNTIYFEPTELEDQGRALALLLKQAAEAQKKSDFGTARDLPHLARRRAKQEGLGIRIVQGF